LSPQLTDDAAAELAGKLAGEVRQLAALVRVVSLVHDAARRRGKGGLVDALMAALVEESRACADLGADVETALRARAAAVGS
jgi:hypothetical protein